MSGFGNKNGGSDNDDLLTAALLEILSQDEETDAAPKAPAIERHPNKSLPMIERHSSKSASADISLIGLGHKQTAIDPYSDSGLSDVFYSEKAGENEVHCRSCGAVCPRTNKYCGFCASYLGNYTNKRQFASYERVAVDIDVALVSINEDGSDGMRIPLRFNETLLGRAGDSRFPSDAFLSPQHARLLVEGVQLFIEDLDSLNGSFLRSRDEVKLNSGDCILAGRQLLRFERFEQVVSTKARSADGTRYMGSPPSGGDFKLVQIGIGNISQNVYCLSEGGAIFGRETGDIVFNKDRFMSGRHAQIYPREDGNYYLIDLNSSNGTWVKMARKTRLLHGDVIFLGQQLFRIESPDIA